MRSRLTRTRSLRVCMADLRAKLEPDSRRPKYLLTEVRLGYRLQTENDGGDAR
ncbi:MAG TPA: winged helix-turn-helix domain-containing protein [Candidatus Paceibacterota bacterium]|nr:winged helix-turn-helix domain-containing protein [Candidatus Paceibacterota bacterium]